MELWLTPSSRSVARWPTPSKYCASAAAFVSGGTKRRSWSPKVLWQAGQRQRWWPWREVPFLTLFAVWQWGQFMPHLIHGQRRNQYLFSNPDVRVPTPAGRALLLGCRTEADRSVARLLARLKLTLPPHPPAHQPVQSELNSTPM